jgi:rod shape-determining protein MreC
MKNSKKKKTNITVVVTLLLTVVVVFSVAGARYGVMMPFSPVKTVINELAGYAGEMMSHPVQSFHHIWKNYIDLVGAKEENRILEARLLDLQAENSGYREIILENRRLKNLLEVAEKYSGRTIMASVTGYDLVPWVKTVTVNRGKKDGVRKDSIALYGRYAAGRITEVFLHFSRVLLITAPDSAVAALVQRNRARGILYGSAEGECRLDFLEKDVKIMLGDTIITSGTDGIFPKGIILGRVSEVANTREHGLFKAVNVKPAINLSRLEEVMIPIEKPELETEP